MACEKDEHELAMKGMDPPSTAEGRGQIDGERGDDGVPALKTIADLRIKNCE